LRTKSFEPLVRVCTKTECRRRRPLAKTSIRFGPSPNSTLRLAARTFLALLFQEPPRLTRLEPVCPQT
jgi:hypothetical protein